MTRKTRDIKDFGIHPQYSHFVLGITKAESLKYFQDDPTFIVIGNGKHFTEEYVDRLKSSLNRDMADHFMTYLINLVKEK